MSDLLAKEKEFYRLNKELEERSRGLFEEVDFYINSFSESSQKKHTPISSRPNSSENKEQKISQTSNETQNKSSPQTSDRQKTIQNAEKNETVNKFLQSKIKILHEELHILKVEYAKQSKHVKDLELDCKKIDESKKKLMSQISTLKENVSKFETANLELQTKLEGQNAEVTGLKKEISDLKKESRTLSQQNASNEVRLQRSAEDNEKLRSTIKLNQFEEKELREQIKKLQSTKAAEIKNLEKQNSELLKAFKKQICLVDNLKKQKACLEATKHIQLSEMDFTKFLERKTD